MSFEENYHKVNSVRNAVGKVVTEELEEEAPITSTESTLMNQTLSTLTISMDIKTLTSEIIGNIVEEVELDIDTINIEEYHSIGQVEIEFYFQV